MLIIGSWTYDGYEVDLVHYEDEEDNTVEPYWQVSTRHGYLPQVQSGGVQHKGGADWRIEHGVDLSDFYPSAEFDIMAVPAVRHEQYFNCCTAPYIDITYTVSS